MNRFNALFLITSLFFAAPAVADQEEQIEVIDDGEMIDTPVPSEELTPLMLIGRFHPPLVHLPIGWATALALADILVILFAIGGLEKALKILHIGTVLSFLPAIGSGLLRFQEYAGATEAIDEAIVHRNVMFIAAAIALIGLVLRLKKMNRYAILFMSLICIGIMTYGAHLGGVMVYGSDYLPF